jgi:hypothetical protein
MSKDQRHTVGKRMSDSKIRNILSDATALHWRFHAMEEKIEKLKATASRGSIGSVITKTQKTLLERISF